MADRPPLKIRFIATSQSFDDELEAAVQRRQTSFSRLTTLFNDSSYHVTNLGVNLVKLYVNLHERCLNSVKNQQDKLQVNTHTHLLAGTNGLPENV